MTELAYREASGICVSLLWQPETNVVGIVYTDVSGEESFATDVPPESALHAFYHPNVYRP